ncbi:MAG: hypothetical protein HYS07_11200 [Chlamydiae bacterium]|nr:hypothetical protein [Chlamydiota bacterium]MBI3278188.1 hypothetical protein [Chlamydiota bacterium]
MDRKIKTTCLEMMGTQVRVAQVSLIHRKIDSVNIDEMTLDAFKKSHLISKNQGRISVIFPVERAFLHEMRIPKNISKRVMYQMLVSNFEVALPFSMDGYEPYSLCIDETKEEVHYLQFILSPDAWPFKAELEMGSLESHPGAIFKGFSDLFSFPEGEVSLLCLEGSNHFQVVWGLNGVMQGIRILRKVEGENFASTFAQTILACPSVKNFFSWCHGKEEKMLDDSLLTSKWTHLKKGPIPDPLKGKEEHLALISAALAHALGYPQEVIGPKSSFLQILKTPHMTQLLIRSLSLFLIAGLIVECLWIASLIKIRRENQNFSQKIESAFYSIFSKETPIINPVEQMKEKAAALLGSSWDSKVRPREFLNLISSIHPSKESGIQIVKISLLAGQLKLDGVSPTVEVVYPWVGSLRSKFHTVELSRVERETQGTQFLFHILIFLEEGHHVSI